MRFLFRKKKIFVIGRNKTGTTSLGAALERLGFEVGNQPEAELLMEDWAKRDFDKIVKLCKTADAFQDIPFSLDYTFQVLDYEFPESKFILTVRSSALEWYDSLIRFHTKIVGKNHIPEAADLKDFRYRRKGWLWRGQQLVYGIDEKTLYNKDIYIKHYESHNKRVLDYFRYRPNDLLVLNVGNADAMKCLCDFVGAKTNDYTMPHLNKS